MKRFRIRKLPRLLCILVACALCTAVAQSAQLISLPDSSLGSAAGGAGDSTLPLITPDGRFVLFSSSANNLVSIGTNPMPVLIPPRLNVYLRDRTNGVTSLVSMNLAGTGGTDADSMPSEVSTNGRYVLFESSAGDLAPLANNGARNVFRRDLVAGTTALVSVATNGAAADGASRGSVMTPDGRYVAFVSTATNLTPDDTNGIADVFVRDLQANTTILVSVGATPTNAALLPTIGSEAPWITPDGRYVAFYSTATNLVPGVATPGEVYVRDLLGSATVCASSYAHSIAPTILHTANIVSYNHCLSDDGQFVAYESSGSSNGMILRYSLASSATDLVATNAAVLTAAVEDRRSLVMTPDGRFLAYAANVSTNGVLTTYINVWDAQNGSPVLASGDLTGQVSPGALSYSPSITADGRFVAFVSNATNLVTNASSGPFHLYVRDLVAGTTTLVDGDTNLMGSGIAPTAVPAFTADGRYIAFEAAASSSLPNAPSPYYQVFLQDFSTNSAELISVHHPALPSVTPNGPSYLSSSSVSSNGQFVAFASESDNLVANDTNGLRDIFLRDTIAGTNLLVSVNTHGWASDGVSAEPSISADGRFVAFTSLADDLVPGDANRVQDVFVRDIASATTVLVSVNAAGTGSGNAASYSPRISPDGRHVLFRSLANNLSGTAVSSVENLFWRDLQSGITYPLTSQGVLSFDPSVTPDGRFIAYGGSSSGGPSSLVVWDSQAAAGVYTNTMSITAGPLAAAISPNGAVLVYATNGGLVGVDRVAGTNWLLGAPISGTQVSLKFDGTGRFFTYSASPDASAASAVYLYDLQSGTNWLISRTYDSGGFPYAVSDSPDISPDGRFVAYRSAATNIVPNDTNGVPDVFVYDRVSGSTTLLSVNRFGTASADNRSLRPVFSADSQTVLFESWASDLAPQDFNQGSDLFAYALLSSSPIPVFEATIVPAASPGQGLWLVWPALPGKTYHVQFKTNVGDPTWQELSDQVTIVGGQGFLNEFPSTDAQRFYRIVAF